MEYTAIQRTTSYFNIVYVITPVMPLVFVVLQVRLVFPSVTSKDDDNSKVNQWLTRGIVAIKVGSLVLAPWGSWLLSSWSWAGRQLLVERNHISHSLGVRVRANVLGVSNSFEAGTFEPEVHEQKLKSTRSKWLDRGTKIDMDSS